MKYTGKELREKYLSFFESKGHKRIPSASLIPENDPTVLFTTAGMQPLVPYLLGEKHPQGQRLTNVQKCIRTGDIEEVGDSTHFTFFEMLGNWSLGDYFKQEAIEWSFEFLTQVLEIPINRLAVSVFAGDQDAPRDEEAAKIWESLGIPKERISFLGKKDNWWGPAGQTGPCGPDTEMFFWKDNSQPAPEKFNPEDERWVEIWNDVFMEYYKNDQGQYVPAKQKNVDTGMGLERTVAILNGLEDAYLTDLFLPIIQKIEELSDKSYTQEQRAIRIIADHIKAAVMIMGDYQGIEPSNVDQGYILRRLIRRAVRTGRKLDLNMNFTTEVAKPVFDIYGEVYPEIIKKQDFILSNLQKEEEKFRQTLEKGLKEFQKMSFDKIIDGKEAFNLFSTYGFPIELIEELATEQGLKVDLEGYHQEFKKHQELSRKGAEQKFKGGLADTSAETTRLHTATHLLHQALKDVLGPEVNQKGSNITPQRLRFDFNYPEKLTPQQIKKIEDIVNEQIKRDLPVTCQEMTVEEAKNQGAIGLFEHKYDEKIKVYKIGDFSMEICGGPHVQHTGELKGFKILKEESCGAGVRRIKAQVDANLE